MGKISKIIEGRRWWTTTVPLETKKLIWQLQEEKKPKQIVEFRRQHMKEKDTKTIEFNGEKYKGFPKDRKTIHKVCQELGRIVPDDLIYLPLHILYYVLKRRPDLQLNAGLTNQEMEALSKCSDNEWDWARGSVGVRPPQLFGEQFGLNDSAYVRNYMRELSPNNYQDLQKYDPVLALHLAIQRLLAAQPGDLERTSD